MTMFIDVHLRDLATGDYIVVTDDNDYAPRTWVYDEKGYRTIPESYDWLIDTMHRLFDANPYNGRVCRVEKIVERGTGRVIWEDDRRALGVEDLDEETRAVFAEALAADYPDLEYLVDDEVRSKE